MNAKHQFKYTYNEGCEEFSPVEVTFDMPGDVTITQMLWNFECYLKSCGFVFDGHLELVNEESDDIIDDTNYCCMGDSDCCEESEEYKAEKLKEWSEGLAKLEAEVKKNKWVHGICNPPSPDWKATNSDHYDGTASANPKEYSKWLNKNKKSDSDNCWNS
jgi:hypothetical protein